MDKEQIITFIKSQLGTGSISKGDLLGIVNDGIGAPAPAPRHFVADKAPHTVNEDSSKNLINTFYVIGAIIAVVGVVILIVQNWDDIGLAGKLLVTLGISFATYVAGLLLRKPEQRIISQVMFTLSAALVPIGAFVLLDNAGIDFNWGTQLLVSCVLTVIFGFALFVSKRNILMLLTVGFATWAYYALVMKVFGFDSYSYSDMNFLKWATILLGVSYLFIGYGFRSLWAVADESDEKEKVSVQGVFYSLGTIGILGAGIFVGGMFDLLFIALIFAAFYGSVYLKSRGMLILGALFLMAHIIKLTYRYFVGSVGWPVALIAIGFLVIGVGYMTFYLNRKFISGR